MAPHCTSVELAFVGRWQSQGLSAKEMWEMHKADRAGRHIQPVCFSAFKKLLNGTTHQGGPEARGRKRKLGMRAVRALDAKRRQLVDRTNGEIEITWAKYYYESTHHTCASLLWLLAIARPAPLLFARVFVRQAVYTPPVCRYPIGCVFIAMCACLFRCFLRAARIFASPCPPCTVNPGFI